MKAWILPLTIFLLLTELSVFAEQVTTRLAAQITSGFNDPDSDKKPTFNIDLLTQEQAHSLFRRFKSVRGLGWDYSIDGCYARAQRLVEVAQRQGFRMGKVFAEGDLQAQTKSDLIPLIQWGWHVAPMGVIMINGKPQVYAFDPALFDRPVPYQEWLQKLQLDTPNFETQLTAQYFGTQHQYAPRDHETHRTKTSEAQTDEAKRVLRILSHFIKEHEPLLHTVGESIVNESETPKEVTQ